MSDSYQAIYDAVRSRISNGDVGEAVESATRCFDGYAGQVANTFVDAINRVADELTRPSTIYRPVLSLDIDAWCAMYGENIQDGVSGFGSTPAEAMAAFDREWTNRRAGQ